MKSKHTKQIIGLILTAILCSITIFCIAQAEGIKLSPDFAVSPSSEKLKLVSALPSEDWQLVLSDIIQLLLGITGSLAFIAFTVGGVMMVTSQGNEEQITKGKTIILYSVLALIIIATSYAIVLGITQLALVS